VSPPITEEYLDESKRKKRRLLIKERNK